MSTETSTASPSTGDPGGDTTGAAGLDGETVARTVDTHLAAYCDADLDRRAEAFASVWAADGELLDPPMEGHGLAEISGLADVVLAHYPGHRFRRTTVVDLHHGWARYGWALDDPDGEVAVVGTDVVQVDEHGRLSRIVGFFGEPEPVGA